MVLGAIVSGALQRREFTVARLAVALGANGVARRLHRARMHVMAVAAAHALCIHRRLQERAVHVDLVKDLAVRVVQPVAQDGKAIGVGESRADRRAGVADGLAPGMTAGALLDLHFRIGGIEGEGQAKFIRALPSGGLECARIAGPGGVGLARPVTGLAADPDLGLGARICPAARIVVLSKIGRMAFGASGVPVLVRTGPVQAISVRQVLLGIDVKPLFPFRIPGRIQLLQAPGRGLDKVLLQWRDPRRVFDLEVGELPVGPVRADEKASVAASKAGRDAIVRKGRIREICQDVPRFRGPPRPGVMGVAPGLGFGLVTRRAGIGPDMRRHACFFFRFPSLSRRQPGRDSRSHR
jgi:hypothetical protein